jgi:hypothetical protein
MGRIDVIGLASAFLLGFAFGGAFLVVLRHEIHLTGHAATLCVLLSVGLLLAISLLLWFSRVSQRIRQVEGTFECSIQEEWLGFLWGSLLLVIIYLVLLFVFMFL